MKKILILFAVIFLVIFARFTFLGSEEISVQNNPSKTESWAFKETRNSQTPELLKYFDEKELRVVKTAAVRNGCDGDLFIILLAIWKAENGRPGCEFGVMHPKAWDTNLDTQAGWAAATVVKNFNRWSENGISGEAHLFIEFLGSKYCPVGAENDPNGLNKHWIKNVTYWYEKLKNV